MKYVLVFLILASTAFGGWDNTLPADTTVWNVAAGFIRNNWDALETALGVDLDMTTVSFTMGDVEATSLTAASPAVDVTHSTYGATGDGSTDDYTAINAAVAAAGENGMVLFPKPSSSYLIGTDITMPSGQTWIGQGERALCIKLSGNNRKITMGDYCSLQNIRIDGDGVSSGQECLSAGGANRWYLNNVRLANAAIGLKLSNSWDGTAVNLRAIGNTNGIEVNDDEGAAVAINDIHFYGGELTQNAKGAYFGTGTDDSVNGVTFTGMGIQGNTTHGIHIAGPCVRVSATGGWFEDNGTYEFLVDGLGKDINGLLWNNEVALGPDAGDKGFVFEGANTSFGVLIGCNRFTKGTNSTSAIEFGADTQYPTLIANTYNNAALTVTDNSAIGINALSDGPNGGIFTRLNIRSLSGGTRKAALAGVTDCIGTATFDTGETTKAVAFIIDQPDTNYYVTLSLPPWDADGCHITNKATTGFTINAETGPAGDGNLVQYMVIRR